MSARRLASLAAAVAAIASVTACGDGSPSTSRGAPPASAPAAAAAVHAAFDVQATLVGGGEFDLSQYAGRPVLLWFWAPF